MTTGPRKKPRVHLLTGQSGKTRDVCSLIAAHSQNANLALQMCAALNSHAAAALFRKMASYGYKYAPLIEQISMYA